MSQRKLPRKTNNTDNELARSNCFYRVVRRRIIFSETRAIGFCHEDVTEAQVTLRRIPVFRAQNCTPIRRFARAIPMNLRTTIEMGGKYDGE